MAGQQVVKEFSVVVSGAGKPDYSQEVALGKFRSGLRLGYGESLKIFAIACSEVASSFSWVRGVLTPGESVNLIDVDTGLAAPYTLAKGYTMEVTDSAFAGGDVKLWILFDTYRASLLGPISGGNLFYLNKVNPTSTATLDPTAAASHVVDAILTSLSSFSIECSATLNCILTAVGTPPLPENKAIICKWCGYTDTVPVSVTRYVCPKCGQLVIFGNAQWRGQRA